MGIYFNTYIIHITVRVSYIKLNQVIKGLLGRKVGDLRELDSGPLDTPDLPVISYKAVLEILEVLRRFHLPNQILTHRKVSSWGTAISIIKQRSRFYQASLGYFPWIIQQVLVYIG